MKPFTMHAVLNYRRQLEDAARQALHQALEAEARLQEALLRTEKELADLHADQRRDQEQGTTVDRLRLFASRIDLVHELIESRRTELAKQQAQVAKKRQVLVKRSKERKIMEKLQEQQDAAYAKFLEKKELAMLDEIAVLSHERRQR
ncbi:flagellar export protein FliJ [Desulfobulbus elongatus]|uniref:flagellar export protein FliJ n=1 Tax=Desulfobulbus elongatus TaxID=53332 RepID=UPI0004858B74|nr:flagellar export protein FliJ [Desulfobulbus elongatus]